MILEIDFHKLHLRSFVIMSVNEKEVSLMNEF